MNQKKTKEDERKREETKGREREGIKSSRNEAAGNKRKWKDVK